MEQAKAIAWAVEGLAHSFEYEYYTNLTLASEAAEVMTILSSEPWKVNTEVSDITRHWIVKA